MLSMFLSRARLLAISVVLMLGACGQRGELAVSDGYIKMPPAGAVMAAGFVSIKNGTRENMIMMGAEVDGFGLVEIHETTMEDGIMRMRPRPGLQVSAGESVAFAPGGLHLMLMQRQKDLHPGDVLKGKVKFRSDDGTEKTLPVDMEVRLPPGMMRPPKP